jgi:hypothetical protein
MDSGSGDEVRDLDSKHLQITKQETATSFTSWINARRPKL